MPATPRGTPSALRRANVQHLLGLIRRYGPISRNDLGRRGELSRPTVQAAVEELLRADLVLESSDRATLPSGRRGPVPRQVRFNSNHALVVGVDVGAAKLLALLSNLDGETLAVCRCPTPANATGPRLDRAVKVLIDQCLEQAGVGRGRLAAATVGTTGVVNRDTGKVTFAPHLPGWQGRTIRPPLEAALRVPVLVESEAHLAMLGESWRGIARGATDAVFIQLGVGVGMGILAGGEIYRGAMGAAGEIGYLPIGDAMTDPRRAGPGTFESAVGAAAFNRDLLDLAPPKVKSAGATIIRQPSNFEGPASTFSSAQEDKTAQYLVDNVLTHLASGLVSVSVILNPELIVLGGGLAALLGPHLARLREELNSRVPSPPRIELSILGDNAVAVGAVKRSVTLVEESLFGGGTYWT